jgi:hypothetical protein
MAQHPCNHSRCATVWILLLPILWLIGLGYVAAQVPTDIIPTQSPTDDADPDLRLGTDVNTVGNTTFIVAQSPHLLMSRRRLSPISLLELLEGNLKLTERYKREGLVQPISGS